MKKPNLLVLGASGAVSGAFLHYIIRHRKLLGKLVLLDRSKKLLSSPYLNHKALDYEFLHQELKFPLKSEQYLQILKQHRIDIVIDLTDIDSLPLLYATDKAGVCYINTALNEEKRALPEIVFEVFQKKRMLKKAAHILCTGMNPGIVNMWVKYGIQKFGKPKEVVHFEYDTSMTVGKWTPIITWSSHEFLTETVHNPTGIMLGRGKLQKVFPNAIENRVDMGPILKPLFNFEEFPKGFLVLHEENMTIAQKYDIPSKFIYAINMKTMDNMEKIYSKKKTVAIKDLVLGDNTNRILDGSDSIGVMLRYDDKQVYYFNTAPNMAVRGTNATCQQVATGVFAALLTMLFEQPKKGVNFVEDIHGRSYMQYVFDNMRVQEFVFSEKKLVEYTPEIRLDIKNSERYYMR